MSTTFVQPRSLSLDQEEKWVLFMGSVEVGDNFSVLRPSEDERVTLTLLSGDVREQLGHGEVRVGAFLHSIDIPENSLLKREAPIVFRERSECDDHPSRCIGGIETCCHSGKVIGSCIGRYTCPED